MAFGNAVGQGFVNPSEIITNIVIIEGDNGELLMYNGTPAAGNLIYSISNRTFYDSYGNEIIGGGAASYLPVVSGDSLATLTNAGGVSYLSGPAGGGGPWAESFDVGQVTAGALSIFGFSAGTNVVLGNNYSFVNYVLPSGDTSGLTDWQNITSVMNSRLYGATVLLMPGTYYILYPLVIPPWTTITGYSNISDNSALSYLGNTTIMPVTGFTNVHGPTDPAAWPVSSAILMIDSASGGYGILSAGQNITGINVDCLDAPAGTNGITLYNAVYGASISEFSILEAPNVGLMAQFASSQVDGLHVYHGLVSQCGRSIDLNVADAVFDDVNGTGALTDHNWYIRNAVDSIFSNCRGGNAAIHNWYFAVNQTATGSYCLLEGCGSDLADSYGMLIDYGNTGGIWLNIVGFSSDQDNAGATTGAIRIASAPQPVEFEGLTINTTANYGLQYLNSASLVVASAIINAAVSAFSNGGGNGTVLINSNAILGIDWNYIGAAGQPAFLNGWSNFGSGNADLAFMQEGNGIKITGVVMGGTASPVFTLPAGLRPVSDQFIWGYNITTGAACALSVNTGGTCALQGALAADEYVFNGKIDLAI